jgi:hypothetical protein
MRPTPIEPITVIIDGCRVRCSTSVASLGSPYVVAFQTSIAEPWLPVELRSVYVGSADGPTHVTSLTHVPDHNATIETVVVDAGVMPVPYARERLLLDHLQRLQDVIADLGYTGAIECDNAAAVGMPSS